MSSLSQAFQPRTKGDTPMRAKARLTAQSKAPQKGDTRKPVPQPRGQDKRQPQKQSVHARESKHSPPKPSQSKGQDPRFATSRSSQGQNARDNSGLPPMFPTSNPASKVQC